MLAAVKSPLSPLRRWRSNFRDFVPWRFSVAGHITAWIATTCRRPKTLYGAITVKADLQSFYSIRLGTIFSSRPNFDWLPRTVTVKGGRRLSRSDLPLTVTSTATSYVGRTNFSAVRVDKTIPRGARHRARRSRHNLVFGRSVRIAP